MASSGLRAWTLPLPPPTSEVRPQGSRAVWGKPFWNAHIPPQGVGRSCYCLHFADEEMLRGDIEPLVRQAGRGCGVLWLDSTPAVPRRVKTPFSGGAQSTPSRAPGSQAPCLTRRGREEAPAVVVTAAEPASAELLWPQPWAWLLALPWSSEGKAEQSGHWVTAPQGSVLLGLASTPFSEGLMLRLAAGLQGKPSGAGASLGWSFPSLM